jgi:hypothetical protein
MHLNISTMFDALFTHLVANIRNFLLSIATLHPNRSALNKSPMAIVYVAVINLQHPQQSIPLNYHQT